MPTSRHRLLLVTGGLLVAIVATTGLLTVATEAPRGPVSASLQASAAPDAAGLEDLEGGLDRARPGEEGEAEEGRLVPLDPDGAQVGRSFPVQVRMASTSKDLRSVGYVPPRREERPEPGVPDPGVTTIAARTDSGATSTSSTAPLAGIAAVTTTVAPNPTRLFRGLDYANWGCGRPPDPNGDVGDAYYVQSVNCSLGIFEKSTGNLVAAVTLDEFAALVRTGGAAATGTPCDTDNGGDPVVVYDTVGQRWIVTDFAFTSDPTTGAITSQTYECVWVSKTADPVSGGWWLYAIPVSSASSIGDLADYPKVAVWGSGIYVTFNMFGGTAYKNARILALERSKAENGTLSAGVIYDFPAKINRTSIFSVLPAHTHVATGLPATDTALMTSIYGLYQVRVWRVTPNWAAGTLTVTGPNDVPSGSFAVGPSDAATPANPADTMTYRLMMQAQYTRIRGAESLWVTHTVANPSNTGLAAPRWYQVALTKDGTSGSLAQSQTIAPDTSLHRYMPSLAVDRTGGMAIAYAASNASTFPELRVVVRSAADTANATGSEAVLYEGGGAQEYLNRWGDYASMSIDPVDGCTFWYTGEVYAGIGRDWQTGISAFSLPSCTGASAYAAPSAPTGLGAASDGSAVRLTWTPGSGRVTGYTVERSTGSGWVAIGSVPGDAVSWSDRGPSAGTSYGYRLSAFNESARSSVSAPAAIRTVPAPPSPSNLVATGATQSTIGLSWSAGAGAVGYQVQRATSSGGPWRVDGTSGTTTYTSRNLARGTTYYYRVRSYVDFYSSFTNTVTAKTAR